jgi:geranylgeranylglycerol-phosphate geranylgeranyltransferase
MNNLSAYIKIVRPYNFLITFLAVIIASLVSYQGELPYIKVFLAAVTASLTMAAGNIINDICDLDGDKINHPERPLPSGILSIHSAYVFYLTLLALSLVISLFISNLNFVVNILAIILLYLYSQKLKRVLLVGNLIVSLLTGLAFLYGGIAVNNIYYSVIPALFAFLINLIREIVKDIEDSEGDLHEGIISFVSKYGIKTALNTIVSLCMLLMLLTLFPYLNGNYGGYYLIVILTLVIPVLIYFVLSLLKDSSRKNLNNLSFLLKLDMVFGLIAVYVGR